MSTSSWGMEGLRPMSEFKQEIKTEEEFPEEHVDSELRASCGQFDIEGVELKEDPLLLDTQEHRIMSREPALDECKVQNILLKEETFEVKSNLCQNIHRGTTHEGVQFLTVEKNQIVNEDLQILKRNGQEDNKEDQFQYTNEIVPEPCTNYNSNKMVWIPQNFNAFQDNCYIVKNGHSLHVEKPLLNDDDEEDSVYTMKSRSKMPSCNRFKCSECTYSCNTKSHLSSHISGVHQKIRPFVCAQCSFAFSQKANLNKHIKSVHEKLKPFKCLECDYTCRNKTHLSIHVKSVHEKLKPFKCLQCDFSCGNKAYLTIHIKSIHEKLKPFKCVECPYACSQKANLSKHVNSVHDKLKSFECLDCHYTCSQKASLTTHIRCVHEKLKPFKCSKCDYECSRKANLSQHIASVHDKLKPFKCLKCDYASNNTRHLANHINSVHEKIKPFYCSECNRAFSQKISLTKHIIAFHETVSTVM